MPLFGKPKQKFEFVPGHLHKVLKSYESWFDFFQSDDELVYLNSAYSRYDSAYGFFFHDIRSGAHRRIDTADSDRENTLKELTTILKDCGPDMKFGDFEPGPGAGKSNFECLNDFAAYFKSVVEGKPGIKSWYIWLEENSDMLNQNLSRADLLRIKHDGFSFAKNILDLNGVDYEESPRYEWISRIHGRS